MKEKSAFRAFFERKGVTLSPKVYFVDAMGTMALGLFATLLMGTIFGTIATYVPADTLVHTYVTNLKTYAQGATGIVLGIAIAYALKAPALVMFSAGVVGMCGNALVTGIDVGGTILNVAAGPAGAFFCALIATEIGKLVSKETKIDILVTPAVTIGVGVLLCQLFCPAIAYCVYWMGAFINYATTVMPFFMGILVSVTVGIILTLPISSAAICAMIGIAGLAGGAATAGCCAQMIGFAVISYRENKFGGLIAQGLGTSMLQMGNIVKRPAIWIAPTFAAAVTGPVSTCLFGLECNGVSAGMGTCGLVGPLGIFSAMGFTATSVVGVLLVCIVLPAVVSLLADWVCRKVGLYQSSDLKLSL